MIKILKPGKIVERIIVYTSKCEFCGCEFEFTEKDGKYKTYEYYGEPRTDCTIVCPYCKKKITFDISKCGRRSVIKEDYEKEN